MAAQKHVVIIDDGYENYDVETEILAAVGADVSVLPCQGDVGRVLKATAEADAVLVRESPVSRDVVKAMQHCKVVVRYGIGVDNIDLKAAAAKHIYVANVPDYGVEEVSDHALALLLTLARRTNTRDVAVRKGAWNVSRAEPMYRMQGSTLGLVGYGRIARALERKMRAIGVARVLVYDPWVKEGQYPDVELVDMDTLCAEADYVSLHCPLTAENRHIVDARRIASMKPHAIVVNTARGGLVDEDALAASLQAGRLFGAGIDVFEQEPPRADHPLFSCANAVLSDHTAWYSEQSVAELQRKAAEEAARVLSGVTPLNWLNKW
jgi:D-3-phosphoglycerate dehydrogenase